MTAYGSFGDDFYVNMNLATEMELPQKRESVLHFFEQVRRRYPNLSNFYSREKDEYVLEQEKQESGPHCWASIEPKRVNSGVINPAAYEDACDQHRKLLELVPYELSLSGLDCESLSVMMGFDFLCKDNHNEVLLEALGVAPGLEKFTAIPYGKVLSHEPAIQFSLDETCRTQCRISFESRTTAFQIRSKEYSEEPISVYVMVRRYDSLDVGENYVDEFNRLASLCRDLVDEYVIENVLQPLQTAISIR